MHGVLDGYLNYWGDHFVNYIMLNHYVVYLTLILYCISTVIKKQKHYLKKHKNPLCLKSDRTTFLYDPEFLLLILKNFSLYYNYMFRFLTHWNVNKLKIMMIYLCIFIPQITQNIMKLLKTSSETIN